MKNRGLAETRVKMLSFLYNALLKKVGPRLQSSIKRKREQSTKVRAARNHCMLSSAMCPIEAALHSLGAVGFASAMHRAVTLNQPAT